MKCTTTFALALTLMCFCSVSNLHAQFSGGGTGTASDPFKIKTADDLNNVRNYIGSSNTDKHFRLMNDIDLTAFLSNYNEGWLPIGDGSNRFTGYFHGGGYKINGLWINRPTVDYVGFFGANSSTIDSLTITVSTKNISGRNYTGGFVGDNSGTIAGCSVEGGSLVSVSGDNYIAGFTGNNSNALSSCHATVSSSSNDNSGGLVGYNTGNLTNCYASGSSLSHYNYSGGLIGNNTGNLTNCYASGSSSSSTYSGGLIGYNAGTIISCYATGNSSVSGGNTYSGGLIGYNTASINNCYATGNSSSSAFSNSWNYYAYAYSGGLIGYNTSYTNTISNCYATGNSSSTSSNPWYNYAYAYSGGFVGYLDGGNISNCYSVGQVTSNAPMGSGGSFAGYCGSPNNLSQCYYNSDITGSMSSVGNNVGNSNALGVTTTGMKLKNTFANWDFNTVWTIDESITYPYLLNMPDYIEGQTSVCPNSTQSYSTYSGQSNYVWTITNGSIVLGQSTNKITVKWNNNTNSAKITVTYNTTTAAKNITIIPLPKPTIAGDMNPTTGTTVYYSTETNMSDYAWTVTGGDIISGQGTAQISVKWDCSSATAGHIKINYSNENGCSAAAATDSTVNKQASPAPTISGELQPYTGISVTYTTEYGMTNYSWTVTGGEIVSGQGTQQITVLWTSTSGKLTVQYDNQYGCTVSSDLVVTPVQLFSGGAGTADNPYIIKTAEQLDNIRTMSGAFYSLANDIDLTDYLKNTITGWNPIPDFSGSFDGRFFKIKGLWINQSNSDNLGLFAANTGTIENVYVTIDSKGIYGNNYIGGLVANNIGNINQCAVTEGSITAKGDNIGGLVGYNNGGAIVGSYSSNTIIWGNQYVGGLVGSNSGYVDNYNIRNAKIHQSYSINTVVGSGYTGGLVGAMSWFSSWYYGTATATLSQSYSAGIVSGGDYTGGFLGYNDNGTITGCYYDEETSNQYDGLGNPDDSQYANIKAQYTSDMMKQKTFLAWDFANVWKISELESYPYFKWQELAPTPPPSSIKQIYTSNNSLIIYPNPTYGIIMIECEPNSMLQIYNLSGKMLYQKTSASDKETIDLSAYPNGVYLIKAGSQYARIIKK